MVYKKLRIEVVEGEADGISYSGERQRRKTILLRVGQRSISKRAFELGAILAVFQVLDGLLTYLGVSLYGIRMEGNAFLHLLMRAYGAEPVLFITKFAAILVVAVLTIYAHSRRWIRPLIALLCVVYMVLAVWPWAYLIARHYAAE